jgi:hypothetical protein
LEGILEASNLPFYRCVESRYFYVPRDFCEFLCSLFVLFLVQTRYLKTVVGRLRLKCDGTRADTRFCLSVKRTSPSKSAGVSVHSTIGSRVVRISSSNAGYTMFRGSVKGTGYPLHSPVFPSLPLPCVTVCHHISTGLYSCKCLRLIHHPIILKFQYFAMFHYVRLLYLLGGKNS